jgi:hypothetical protein
LLNDAPLENEPGHNKSSRDFIPYQKSIEFKNIDFAICDMILKQKIPEPFQLFYPFVKEHFINNYDKLLTFIQSHKTDSTSTLVVPIYSMNTHIDYPNLEKKLIKTKQFIDSQK